MSIAGDLLATAMPARLLFRRGTVGLGAGQARPRAFDAVDGDWVPGELAPRRERVQRLEAQWNAAGRGREVLSIAPTPSFAAGAGILD